MIIWKSYFFVPFRNTMCFMLLWFCLGIEVANACQQEHDNCHAQCSGRDSGKCFACCNVEYALCSIEGGNGDALPDDYLSKNQQKCNQPTKSLESTNPDPGKLFSNNPKTPRIFNPSDPESGNQCVKDHISERERLHNTWKPYPWWKSKVELKLWQTCMHPRLGDCNQDGSGTFNKTAFRCCVNFFCGEWGDEVEAKELAKCEKGPSATKPICITNAKVKAVKAKEKCFNSYPSCVVPNS